MFKVLTNVIFLKPGRCQWTHCVNPPSQPNMSPDSEPDELINFDAFVTYTCNTGYYFEEDKNKTDFQIQCLSSATFQEPPLWPRCVDSKICLAAQKHFPQRIHIFVAVQCINDPPSRDPMGSRKWIPGSLDYEEVAMYDCGPHAKFQKPNEIQLVDFVESKCQWDKTWSLTEIYPCIRKFVFLKQNREHINFCFNFSN